MKIIIFSLLWFVTRMQCKSLIALHVFWMSHFITHIAVDAKVIVDFNSSLRHVTDVEPNFGGSLPEDGMTGYLVVANPLNACVPIQPPPQERFRNYINYFALIQESNCQFSHQVYMAQVSQYKAAIIYLKDSNDPVIMTGMQDADKVIIPSVNVGKDGGLLLKRYDYKTRSQITIQPNIKVSIAWYLVPFLVVFGVCFLFMAIFSIARCVRNRRNIRNSRLPKESLKSLPTKKFKKGDEYDICAICLEEFEVGDKLRILPCNHVYHCKCVDPWLTGGKKSCPVCNRPVEIARKQKKSRRQQIAASTSSSEDHPPSNSEASLIVSPGDENEDLEVANERTPLISGTSRRPQNNGAMNA